jgi:hypothetical protein
MVIAGCAVPDRRGEKELYVVKVKKQSEKVRRYPVAADVWYHGDGPIEVYIKEELLQHSMLTGLSRHKYPAQIL